MPEEDWNPACFVNPAACAAKDAAVGGALDEFTDSIASALETVLQLALTFWMNPTFSPRLASQDPEAGNMWVESEALSNTQNLLNNITIVAAVVGILIACATVAMTQRAQPLIDVGKMFMAVIAAGGLAAIVMQIGISWGDYFAPWFIEASTSMSYQQGSADLIPKEATAQLSVFLLLVFGGLVVLAGLAQVMFMLFRAGVIPLLVALLPLVAAMTTYDMGKTWAKKILAWCIAFVLYKPIAAVIYGMGFMLIHTSSMDSFSKQIGSDVGAGAQALFQVMTGAVILIMAVLCLPAMIKLVSPIAATGSSSLFSGAAAAGAVVTGAVAVGSAGTSLGLFGGSATAATATGANLTPPPPTATGNSAPPPSGGSDPADTALPAGGPPNALGGGDGDASPPANRTGGSLPGQERRAVSGSPRQDPGPPTPMPGPEGWQPIPMPAGGNGGEGSPEADSVLAGSGASSDTGSSTRPTPSSTSGPTAGSEPQAAAPTTSAPEGGGVAGGATPHPGSAPSSSSAVPGSASSNPAPGPEGAGPSVAANGGPSGDQPQPRSGATDVADSFKSAARLGQGGHIVSEAIHGADEEGESR